MIPERAIYLAAAVACGAGGLLGLAAWIWGGRNRTRILWGVVGLLPAALVLVAWGIRWYLAGHLPLFGTYESALSLAVAVMVMGCIWEYLGAFDLRAAPIAALVAAGLLVHGLAFDDTIYALTISERSWVVDIHAFFAWSAFGVLSINAALAVRELVFRNPGAPGHMLRRTLEIGFGLHTGMLASGSFYKFLLFGKVWSFDPIETMGLVAWIAYGALLHMCLFAGWRGRKLAAWCAFLFVLLVLSYRVIVYFPAWSSYHILDMDLRIHVPG